MSRKLKVLIPFAMVLVAVIGFIAACGSSNNPTTAAKSIPTNTPTVTITATPCNGVPGAPPAETTYNVNGTLTYTGSKATVDANHSMGIELLSTSYVRQFSYIVATNGGSYYLNAPSAGNYIIAYYLSAVVLPCDTSGNGGGSLPRQGDPYNVYNDEPTISEADDLAINGSTALNQSFDDTYIMSGVSGTIHYTGSEGAVNCNHRLYVALYSDSGYTTLDTSVSSGYSALSCNNTSYNQGTVVNGSNEYLLAYFDEQGTGWPIAAGDDCVSIGGFIPSTTMSQNITIGTNPYP